MLRYFNSGPRNFKTLPDVPTQRFNWEFYVIFNGRISPEPLTRKVPQAESKNFWVIPPGKSYYWKYRDPVVDRAVFHFARVDDLLREAVAEMEILALTLNRDQLDMVRSLAVTLTPFYRKPTALSRVVYEKTMLELSLLALSGRHYSLQHTLPNLPAERVQRAIAWYREHMAERPTLEDVAANTHISASHLRRHFYEETGASPSHAFLDLRMQKSAEVLSTSSLTLEEVSQICGFSSAADFCRVFKRYYKTTAHVWRRKVSRKAPGQVSESLLQRPPD